MHDAWDQAWGAVTMFHVQMQLVATFVDVSKGSWSGKLLLALASTVILGSESHGTHGHILVSHDSGSHATPAPKGSYCIEIYFIIKFVSLRIAYCVCSVRLPVRMEQSQNRFTDFHDICY
jgi:hypothetical protein